HTRERIQSKRILRGKRVIAPPTQSEFIEHSSIDNPGFADRRGMRFQVLPSVSRRAGAVDDSTKTTRNEPETIRIDIADEHVLIRIDLRVTTSRIGIRVVQKRGDSQIIVGVQRPASRHEIWFWNQPRDFLCNRVKASGWNLVVGKVRRTEGICGAESARNLLDAITDIVEDVGVGRSECRTGGRREIAGTFAVGRDVRQSRLAANDACAFIVEEAEQAVLDDGGSKVPTKLVLAIFRFLGSRSIQEKIGCIE